VPYSMTASDDGSMTWWWLTVRFADAVSSSGSTVRMSLHVTGARCRFFHAGKLMGFICNTSWRKQLQALPYVILHMLRSSVLHGAVPD
jgi:hypothetical protein